MYHTRKMDAFFTLFLAVFFLSCNPTNTGNQATNIPENDPEEVASNAQEETLDTRIALYIGNDLYPGNGSMPDSTIQILQNTALTSPILGLMNQSAKDSGLLVFNDAINPVFDSTGSYIGSAEWSTILANLIGGDVREIYLSFSTNGTTYMSDLISSNEAAALKIFSFVKDSLGFDGIDLDYEDRDLSSNSPIYPVAATAVKAGLKLTAAPFFNQTGWQTWVQFVQGKQGTVAWLNLQCYAGGIRNNPGDWLEIGVPIVAGSCKSCCCPQTNCTPAEMQNLFTLWRTGQGTAASGCWQGTANTQPQAIGGGFIWVYSNIKGAEFSDYMNAVKNGLGM